MDVTAVKNASRQQPLDFAAAAIRSGPGHIRAADVLLEHGNSSYGAAYSQAVLAVEEFGEGGRVITLALRPDEMRARAPVKELLEWHLLKQFGGLLTAVLGFGGGMRAAETITKMPVADIAQMLEAVMVLAQDADGVKLRGIYADLAPDGTIREPSQVTEQEAREQLDRARESAAVADKLVAPETMADLAELSQPEQSLSSALFGMVLAARPILTAHEAAQLASDAAAMMLGAPAAADDGREP